MDCLAKKMKRFVELKAVTAEVTFVDVIAVLEQMEFSLSELSDYLNSVADFTFCSTVPKFPVQFHQTQQFDRNSTMNLTAELAPCERFIEIRQKFPDYVGKSSRELEMNQCVANVDLNDTLDSMASPFLELRRIPTRKMSKDLFVSSSPKFNHRLSKCDVAEKGFRSVLSNKGLTLRLLNCNADTPPGFFSSRSQK
uniref:Uncharacterized protein n=1 Tax=Globodera rostochiensis TaxID=31243 RepID=A0A914GUY2_GLORO